MSNNICSNISVDCVIFGFDFSQLNVLLIERKLEDDKGKTLFFDHTLVGNHVRVEETLDAAATRILKESTGLSNIYLEQFYTFGDPKRLKKDRAKIWLKSIDKNPDARVVSIGYFSLINISDVHVSYTQRHASWYNTDNIENLGFDHNEIFEKAKEALQTKIKTHPIAFELLPQKFTLSQLQKLYEVVLEIEIDKRNFRKKVATATYIVPLNEKQQNVSHKPAQLYIFSREIFEATKKKDFNFSF